MVRIEGYPQFALICWNRDKAAEIEEAEALALYERNGHLVAREAMGPAEAALLARFVRDHRHGVLNV